MVETDPEAAGTDLEAMARVGPDLARARRRVLAVR